MGKIFWQSDLPVEPTEQEMAHLKESLDRLAANEATNCDDIPLFGDKLVQRCFRKGSGLVGNNSRSHRGALLFRAAACLVLLFGCGCGAAYVWRGGEILMSARDEAVPLELVLDVASVEEMGDASLAASVGISADFSGESVMLEAVTNGAALVNEEESSSSSLSVAASSASSVGKVVVADVALNANNAVIRKTADEKGVSEEVTRAALFIEGLRGAIFEVSVDGARTETRLDLSAFPTLRDIAEQIEDSDGAVLFPLVPSDEMHS